MSKYNKLWEFIQNKDSSEIKLTFDEVKEILGVSIDHSFLNYKKELVDYGYQVMKISLKEQTIIFTKINIK